MDKFSSVHFDINSLAQVILSAAFVLPHTRIGKGAMKKFGINFLWRVENFLIVIFHLSIGKAAVNALRLWKDCLTSIEGATVFVVAFPIVNEI